MEKKKNGLLPLNIQLFADGDSGADGNGGDNTPPQDKTYSQDEYNKLKAQLDKVNAENKKYKDADKARMSEEEKRAEKEKEEQEQREAMIKENRQLKMSAKLASGGFSEQEIKDLIDLRLNDDDVKFTDYLVNLRKGIYDNAEKTAKEKYTQSNYVPGGQGGSGESEASARAKNFGNSNVSKIDKWGQFNNK